MFFTNDGRKRKSEKTTRDQCYDFLNIFAEKNRAKKLAFLPLSAASFCKNVIITLVFEENANFFRRKLAKNRRKL
jgi:hypothetical protein